MRCRLLVILLLLPFCGFSQYRKKWPALFDEGSQFPRSGWLFGPGVTAAWPFPGSSPSADILLNSLRVGTKPGVYAEIGRFHVVPSGLVFNNLDYSVAFRQIQYRQEAEGTFTGSRPDSSGLNAFSDKAFLKTNHFSVNFNLNSVIRFSAYQWIQPSIGIHAGFPLGERFVSAYDTALTHYSRPANKTAFMLHVKLAYGAKLTSELFIVPGIELGLWNLADLPEMKAKQKVFFSDYIPVVFSLKFLLHRPLNLKPCDVDIEEPDLSDTRRKKKKVRLF